MLDGRHKKCCAVLLALAAVCLPAPVSRAALPEGQAVSSPKSATRAGELLPGQTPRAAKRLMRAYPEAGMTLERDASGLYLLVNGERVLFAPSEGCPRPLPDAAGDQPLCASFSQAYPTGAGARHPDPGFAPGRVRSETLLKLLYGADAEAARNNCVLVDFLGQQLLFNARHGAAAALERVGKRLDALVSTNPDLAAYIFPIAGTFSWRSIEGSHRLSAHSFGLCIDLNVNKGPYWRWSKQTAPAVVDARANYPQAIVDAFESEGFIWGGKWHSFDFMHFEYRPELFPEVP